MTSTTKRRRQRAQRIALHFVLTASWMLLLGSEYWSIHEERATALRSAQAQSLNLANSLAQHASDTLSIADAVLSGLVSRVEHDQGSRAARSAMHEFLVHEARRSDRLHGIFIYAADGSWVSSSLGSTPGRTTTPTAPISNTTATIATPCRWSARLCKAVRTAPGC